MSKETKNPNSILERSRSMKKTIGIIIMPALLALCLHQTLLADVIETKIHSVSSENTVPGRDAINTRRLSHDIK